MAYLKPQRTASRRTLHSNECFLRSFLPGLAGNPQAMWHTTHEPYMQLLETLVTSGDDSSRVSAKRVHQYQRLCRYCTVLNEWPLLSPSAVRLTTEDSVWSWHLLTVYMSLAHDW